MRAVFRVCVKTKTNNILPLKSAKIQTKHIYLVLLELHVDHQHLGPHQNLIFDPRTCSGLSKRLEVLNASKNKMVDLAPIDELTALQSLNVSENQLSDLASTIDILAKMKNLKSFDLRGNPLTKLLRYRESIIVSNPYSVFRQEIC